MNEDIICKLGKLRGKPFTFKPKASEVPCIETSDNEKLCRNPLVSVHMITYNHERYIRQAIEGVMMQKTDFEFELVIGEDASPDKTREICFEYQKKYPDKIRVLWSENNTFAIGANMVRVDAACRGKYIAFCEGDDYWINPNKLQRQVDAFRNNPKLGMCLMATNNLIEATGELREFDPQRNIKGLVKSGRKAVDLVLNGGRINGYKLTRSNYQTSGWMIVRELLEEYKSRVPEVASVRLSFGDTLILALMAQWSDLYFIEEVGSVYRINRNSLSFTNTSQLKIDGILFLIYWLVKVRNWPFCLAKFRYLWKIRKAQRKK